MATSDDARDIALSLPETGEKLAWGQPTFRVRNKIFASLGDDDASMGFKFPREERAEMIAAEPSKFFLVEGHDNNYNWLRVHLDAVDTSELREIILDAWRLTAPKSLTR